MQFVGAGLRHDHYLSARALAVFGAVGIGQDVEFAYRIDPEQFLADAAGCDRQLARSHVFHAVHEEEIVARTTAIHGERIAVAGAGIGALQRVVERARD